MPRNAHTIALRTTLIYAALAGVWIAASDRLLAAWGDAHGGTGLLPTYKGAAFVVVTAVILYLGLRAQLRRLHAAADATNQVVVAKHERGVLDSRLAHIAASVPGVILSYQRNPNGTHSFPYTSPAAQDFYGFSSESIAADPGVLFERVHPDDTARVVASIDESARSLAAWRCEFRYVHPVKGVIWLEGAAIPERLPDGGTLWNGFVMDVSERKRAEWRIHQLNRVYAVLSEINQTMVRLRQPKPLFEAVCRIAVEHGRFRMAWIGSVDDATGQVTVVSHAGAVEGYFDALDINVKADPSTFGPTALAVTSGQHVVCNDIAVDPRLARWRDAALARGYRASAALPIRVNGAVHGVLNLYADEPNVFDQPEVQLLDDLAVDIAFALEVGEQETRRRCAEESLRENEERFRQLAENIREVFWLTEPETGRVLYVSPGFETVWGQSAQALYNDRRVWTNSIHPEDRERVMRASANQLTGTYDEEYRILRPDGGVRWVRARGFPVRDARGNVYRVAGLAEDVSERRQLEQQFLRAQRLDAIGTLAGGIAHDLNNVLAPIMMCAPMLRMALAPAELDKMIGTIEASTRRGADLVRQLLLFGRGVESGRSPVMIRDLVFEMQKIARETFPKNIVVRGSAADSVWPVLADATQLHQVLLNLCVNARDAMPNGGELTIAAENVDLNARNEVLPPNMPAGRYVRVRVTDTGTGIEQNMVDRIFDPFFTTKPLGQGTGLGLSTVLGIVKGHGGCVRLDTQVGRGSTFDVYLPAKTERASPRDGAQSLDVPRGNDELILVADDEQSIREVIADVLIRHGYRVLTAEDGVEAEALYRRHAQDVALIVTDMDMPRMDGLRLVQAVRRLNGQVPVVVSSGLRTGRGPNNRGVELDRAGVTASLAKPFTRQEILFTVHAAIAGRRNSAATVQG
jgi:PAS domain S-box-containing protein